MTVPVVRFVVKGVPEAPSKGLGRPYVVVYDGMCKVCTRLSKVLEAWDRGDKIEVVPSQASGVRARFPWIPDHAFDESIQVIGPGKATWQGAAAIEQILRILPKGLLVRWVFKLPRARPLAERFYRWFARNRYRLGCGEHCQYRHDGGV